MTRSQRVAMVAVLAVLLAQVMPGVSAQPMFRNVESIETMVSNADVIVVAHLSRFDLPQGRHGFPSDVVVDETLKGKPAAQFTVEIPDVERRLSGWRDAGTPLLISIPRDSSRSATVMDLTASDLAALTADLKVLRSRQAITRAVREAVRRGPSEGTLPSQAFAIPVPYDLVAGTRLISGVTNVLVVVPVDARLERWALAALRSPQSENRREAVEALRYFRSDSNVRLLMALLTDEHLAYRKFADGNLGHEVRIYFVRESAYDVLKSWGLTPPQPVLEVDTYRPELVQVVVLGKPQKTTTVEEIKALHAFPNLRKLSLWQSRLAGGAFAELASFENLEELNLSYTNTGDADVEALTRLQKLELLDLTSTAITDKTLTTVLQFGALKRIGLNGTGLTRRALADLQAQRPELKIFR